MPGNTLHKYNVNLGDIPDFDRINLISWAIDKARGAFFRNIPIINSGCQKILSDSESLNAARVFSILL